MNSYRFLYNVFNEKCLFLYKYSTTHIIIQLYENIRCIKNVKNNAFYIMLINEIGRTTYNQEK